MTDKWDTIWHERAGERLTTDPWLLRVLPLLPPGRVLDLACGRGRNALFMAERGYAVTAVDASAEALAQLDQAARRRGLAVTTGRIDLEHAPLSFTPFDVVLQFFYLQRSLISALQRLVRPGGVAVLRTFSRAGPFAGGPGNPDYVLQQGELLRLFAGWEVLLHEEGRDRSHRGGSLAGIAARRPARTGRPCA
jgi:SAM-dependent methyltransferase